MKTISVTLARYRVIDSTLEAHEPIQITGKPAKHPEAEKAMAKIVLKKDDDENLKFHTREVVTFLQNDKVRGGTV